MVELFYCFIVASAAAVKVCRNGCFWFLLKAAAGSSQIENLRERGLIRFWFSYTCDNWVHCSLSVSFFNLDLCTFLELLYLD